MAKEEKPWMEMTDCESLSHDDWMWENTGLAERIMEGRTHKPVIDIIKRWVDEESNPELPMKTEKLDDGSLKIHWLHDEDWAGLILKPEDFTLFEEAAYRKLKAVIAEYAEMHDYDL